VGARAGIRLPAAWMLCSFMERKLDVHHIAKLRFFLTVPNGGEKISAGLGV
jgi:hypothetical protein